MSFKELDMGDIVGRHTTALKSTQEKLESEFTAEKEKEMLFQLMLSLNAGNSGDPSDRIIYARTQLSEIKASFEKIDKKYESKG